MTTAGPRPLPAEIGFEPARPDAADARLVMAWRNDPVSLAAAYHPRPKLWPDFLEEFRSTYFTAVPGPVFAVHLGRRIGFLRLEPADHPPRSGRFVEIGINLAPDSRGRGLGVAVLLALDGHLRAQGVDGVMAEVRAGNAASLRAFAAAGYQDLGPAVVLVADTGEQAAIVRFMKDLRP
ncbi:GNAT family N-acetyltransferase [Oleisolibacter albus]|uniref:GNAT family N-acetyltransferase n=1 Tax=Oleisolibacter albus TaxID=2171757 RepID=UPI000DF15897|nr:GNAT family N-acetyltransferase [Oleisolibacter albus]